MTVPTRPSRVVEWAELVGDSVPDVARDAEGSAPSGASSEATTDSQTRRVDTQAASSSNDQ